MKGKHCPKVMKAGWRALFGHVYAHGCSCGAGLAEAQGQAGSKHQF